MTIRVVIADGHAPTRLGVRATLEEAGMEVCGEAATATAAVETAIRVRPDVALIEVHMPGNGIAAARQISEQLPETSIVMLTASRSGEDLLEALKAGAKGYLLKDIDPHRLPFALQGVLAGEAALPRGLVTKLIEEFRHREQMGVRPSGPLARLTAREWEVLDLMRHGNSTAEIARQLFVTPVTVRTHVSAVLRKLQAPNRDAAVRIADGRAQEPRG